MSKRKWKVYTTDELRDRFQPKPGSNATASDDQKVVAPNMKRRNSAPPGMIHFPPGTFSTATSSSSNISGAQSSQHQPSNVYHPSSPHQQHELVTHTTHTRNSPTNKPLSHPYPSRLEKRRASLPFIPPSTPPLVGLNPAAPSLLPSSSSSSSLLHSPSSATLPQPPSIEAYLNHLQQIPLAHHDEQDDDPDNPPLSPSHSLPSFQSLLQTIREDVDEEDSEIREIEEHANGSPKIHGMQTSKTLPMSFKDMPAAASLNKSPNQQQQQQQQHHYQSFAFPPSQPQEPSSPSSKFYKTHNPSNNSSNNPSNSPSNNLSKSSDNLPSLSRMSISDIIG